MKKETLAISDLDAAVAAVEDTTREHTTKCLIAQFAHRITGKVVVGSTSSAVMFEDNQDSYNFRVKGMSHLVWLFDAQAQKPENIAKIRHELPLEVEVTY